MATTKTSANIPTATADAVELLREDVEALMVKHQLAFQHFRMFQFWFFLIPQALLTLTSSILAFLATSTIAKGMDNTKTSIADVLTTIVGSIAGLAVFLQTVSSNFKYEERATQHNTMANNLRSLKTRLKTLESQRIEQEGKIKQLPENNNGEGNEVHNKTLESQRIEQEGKIKQLPETNNGEGNEVHNNIFDFMQTQLEEFQSVCSSRVPFGILDAFDAMESKLDLLLLGMKREAEKLDGDEKKRELKIRSRIRFRARDILSTEISQYWGYPLMLPNSKKMVTRSLNILAEDLTLISIDDHKDFEKLVDNLKSLGKSRWNKVGPTKENKAKKTSEAKKASETDGTENNDIEEGKK